jgi:hypothetical protein
MRRLFDVGEPIFHVFEDKPHREVDQFENRHFLTKSPIKLREKTAKSVFVLVVPARQTTYAGGIDSWAP